MSKTKLFEAWTFKLALPEPFDDPQYSGAKDFGLSQYNQTGRVRKATLHAPTLRALLAYAKLQSATEQAPMINLKQIGTPKFSSSLTLWMTMII